MNPMEILEFVIDQFYGIHKMNLKTAELNICNHLVSLELAEWVKNPDVPEVEDYDTIRSKLPNFQDIYIILSDSMRNGERGSLLGVCNSFDEAKNAVSDLSIGNRVVCRENDEMRIEKIQLGEYDENGF